MKRLLPFLISLFACISSEAANQIITATITVTNTTGTTNGQTITVNSDVRTWTNSVVVPLSQILTNNSIGGCATNMFNAVSDSPFLNLSLGQLTNGITLQTITVNGPLVVSLSPGWGTYVLATNTLTSAQVVRVPLSVEYSTNQTNIATYLVQGLESSTYGLSATAPAASNYVSLSQAQTITGQKTILSPIITNEFGKNGFYTSPTLTNGINYGNAFSSRGTNTGTEQFGANATAPGLGANAFGNSATASGASGLAVGPLTLASGANSFAGGSGAQSTGDKSTALGNLSTSGGTNSFAGGFGALSGGVNSLALGEAANSAGSNSTALGQSASAAYNNSTAIGQGATTTTTNQIVLGQAAQYVLVPGSLVVSGSITNAYFASTNNFPAGSDVSFGRFAITSIVNGNNAGVVVGTNVYCALSGPSGAFTINGIAGGRDGKLIILVNRTGQNMTIANDSGVDPTSANRIYCLTGADKSVTGNSAAILIYDATVTHWVVLSFTQ